MLIYHPPKFGCKKISNSVDIEETVIADYMSPQCDLELEDSKPTFLHDTLAHVASPYQVWLQVSSREDILQTNIHWNYEPFQ